MWPFILFLAVVCSVLAYLLRKESQQRTKLFEENCEMKARQELAAESAVPGQSDSQSLTVDDVVESVRFAGYVPEKGEGWIRFMISGAPYLIDTGRLPQIFVVRDFDVDTKEWEMDLLKHAAHLMSDELIMIKAIFFEDAEGCELRFFVAAMDRNYASFRDNLTRYIGLIQQGQAKMNEIYENLVKEKRDAAIATNPFKPASQTENKVLS